MMLKHYVKHITAPIAQKKARTTPRCEAHMQPNQIRLERRPSIDGATLLLYRQGFAATETRNPARLA